MHALPHDETEFAALVDRHRRELQSHCYRMTGSLEDSEDLVQETFLRAWRGRAGYAGQASVRSWLYRIATNASLDAIKASRRRGRPLDERSPAEVPWLQPYPDALIAPRGAEPDAALMTRESVELAFLTAIQRLPPRQRAVLVLRDVVGWSAAETAALLEISVASANSALQRARAAVREAEQAPPAEPSDREQAVLERFMSAFERADPDAFAALLSDDVRATMPPAPMLFKGIEPIVGPIAEGVLVPSFGTFRALPTRANGLPAAALYLRPPGDAEYRPFALDVLRVEGGLITEMIGFACPPHGPAFSPDPTPDLFPRFGLPSALAPA
jgi:RNA polymerase sigma-70 factor (ECF subfamily)